MKAVVQGHVIADSQDVIEAGGYLYFPPETVRHEWLTKMPKTESDIRCPHAVQFYDVVIDGVRHGRAAWSYESPKPVLQRVAGHFGFWEDVNLE